MHAHVRTCTRRCLPQWLEDDSALVATISTKYKAYITAAAASNEGTAAGVVNAVFADLLGTCDGLGRLRQLLLSCPSHTSSATCRLYGDGCYWDSYCKICDGQNFGLALLLDASDPWVKAFDDADGLCQAKGSRAACAAAGKITIATSLYSNPRGLHHRRGAVVRERKWPSTSMKQLPRTDLSRLTAGLTPSSLVNRFPASVLVLTRSDGPACGGERQAPDTQAVVGAARYGTRRLAALGGEQMVTRCCTPPSGGGGSSAAVGGSGDMSSSPVVTPSSDPDLDRLLYNIVAWAADAGGGGASSNPPAGPERDPSSSPSAPAARLCVSGPRYLLGMARFVSQQTESTSSPGNSSGGGGAVHRSISALPDAVPLGAFLQSQLLPNGGAAAAAAAGATVAAAHSRRQLRQQPGQAIGEEDEEAPLFDATSITVNAITGPLGLTFSGYVSDPGGNLTLASGPSPLSNAELAAAAYVEYLQGQVALSPPDLHFALNTITRARATLPRSSSGSGIYGSGAEAFWALSDAAAVLAAGGLLSPPSPPPSSPPPPSSSRRPQPPPHPSPSPAPSPSQHNLSAIAAGLLSMTAVGCVAELPTARLLPYLVTANAPGRSNSMDRCVGAAAVPAADRFRTAGLGVSSPAGPQPPGAPSGPVAVLHVGVSGTQCWYGEVGTTSQPPPAPATSRQLDGARCSTVCPGAPSERCGGPPSTVNGTAAVLMSVVRIELQLPAAVPPEVVPPPPPTESKQQLPPSPQQQPQRPSPAPTTGGGGGASGGSSGRHPPPPSRDHGNGRGTGSSSGGRGSAAPPPRMVVKLRPGTVVRPVMQQHGGSRRAAAEPAAADASGA
ncbi:hypothetical protein HYH02_014876 [Chlamydomonas schloesseri]|uniref:Uncharacterized protein n=1 Tax=Chlamydomonas schloesseri TaxID=2026947 RepID=A0A835VUJ2_9CHLO|nr:hypothetical protein HYH02_014876 [Chlamydomonas schloesseri]|eukprot:KAG2426014.1 hypothetical protein HYH02_014876 [Chlamydomonas schloesseri]